MILKEAFCLIGAATVSKRKGGCSTTLARGSPAGGGHGHPGSPLTEALLAAVGGSLLAALPQDGGPTAHRVAAVGFCGKEEWESGDARAAARSPRCSAGAVQGGMAAPWGDDTQHPAVGILHQGPIPQIYTQRRAPPEEPPPSSPLVTAWVLCTLAVQPLLSPPQFGPCREMGTLLPVPVVAPAPVPGRKRALEAQVRAQLSFLPVLLQVRVARGGTEPGRHFTNSEGHAPAGDDKQGRPWLVQPRDP